MQSRTRNGLLVGAGFLLGTVGLKVLMSEQARQCYVKGVAYGLRAKDRYEAIVEEAKAQVDDIVAEATYLAADRPEGGCPDACVDGEEAASEHSVASDAVK